MNDYEQFLDDSKQVDKKGDRSERLMERVQTESQIQIAQEEVQPIHPINNQSQSQTQITDQAHKVNGPGKEKGADGYF